MTQRQTIEVVAGVIRRGDGKILICLRPKYLDQGGLWEFPGGKREDGESRIGALRRELNEELGIEIRSALPLLRLTHRYPNKTVDLDVWEVSAWRGSARGREGQKIKWVTPSMLGCYAFPEANRTIITAAGLPRVASVMPELRGDTALSLATLDAWLSAGARCFVLCDQYLIDNPDNRILAQIGHRMSRFNAKLVLDWSVRTSTAATDVDHRQLLESIKGQIDCGILAGSPCRTPAHLEQARQVGADLLFIGPLDSADFATSNDAINWLDTLRLAARTTIPAFAFGNLGPQDTAQAIASGCQGVLLPSFVWAADPKVVMDTVASAISQVEVADECV